MKRKGRFATHKPEKIVGPGEVVLRAFDLAPVPDMCALHPDKPVELKCRHDGAMCCHMCTFSAAHKDHAMDLIADAAPIARTLLHESAFMPTTSSAPAAAVPSNGAADTPAVVAARTAALRVASEHAALAGNAAAALSTVDAACDAAIAAVETVRTTLTARVHVLVQEKDVSLQTEQVVRDDQLAHTRTVATGVLQATAVLRDVDVVAHADALVGHMTSARLSIDAMPPAPQSSAAIGVCTDGLAAMLAAVPRMVYLLEGGGGGGGQGSSVEGEKAAPTLAQAGVTRSARGAAAASPPTTSVSPPLPPPSQQQQQQRSLAAATAAQHTPVIVGRVSGPLCFTDMVAAKATAALSGQLQAVKADSAAQIQSMRADAISQMQAVKADTATQVQTVKTETSAQLQTVQANSAATTRAVKADMQAVQTDVALQLKALQEQVDRMPQVVGPLTAAVAAKDVDAVRRRLAETRGGCTEEIETSQVCVFRVYSF